MNVRQIEFKRVWIYIYIYRSKTNVNISLILLCQKLFVIRSYQKMGGKMLTKDDRGLPSRGCELKDNDCWRKREGGLETPKFGWHNNWTSPEMEKFSSKKMYVKVNHDQCVSTRQKDIWVGDCGRKSERNDNWGKVVERKKWE